MEKYRIGEPILFKIGKEMTIGELIAIIETNNGSRYQIRTLAEPPTADGWEYYLVSEEQILDIIFKEHTPIHDEWTTSHITEINEAFGNDVSHTALIIIYNSLEKAEGDFGEFAFDEEICRQVLDKWVFLAC